MAWKQWCVASAALAYVVGCGSSGGGEADGSAGAAGAAGTAGTGAEPQSFGDLSELVDQGIDEYFGAADPIGSEDVDGATVYDFAPEDGPVCLRGAPFNVAVRDRGSENLMVFLQGGGACFPFLCAASETANRGMPALGILDPDNPDNPVADWNVVYVPYCDGSVFSGDSMIAEGVDMAGERTHHGLQNISAALDIAEEHFPEPKKVLFAGSSAGGFGTVYDRALVRLKYPHADLFVMNDAGIGINTRLPFLVESWNTSRFAAPSCTECADSGHATPIAKWFFEHDSNVVVGLFSSWEDAVIRNFSSPDPVMFRMQVDEETGKLRAAFPDRYKRFMIEGEQHTALQIGFGNGAPMDAFHDTKIRDVSVAQWVGMMLERDPGWTDLVE